jgi:hypothetical protein
MERWKVLKLLVSSFTYLGLISPGPKPSQRMFLATTSHDDSFSRECRLTSTTVVVFGRQDPSENMHDVCLIASPFPVLVFVSNLSRQFARQMATILSFLDNLEGLQGVNRTQSPACRPLFISTLAFVGKY